MTGFSQGMQSAQSDLNSFSQGWSGLESAVTTGMKVIGTAAVAGFAALGGALAGATKSAISMEQSIANIAAVMRLTSEESKQISELISELNIDPALKVSAVEAAAAIEMLGKNGMTLDEILNGAARSAILLANATGADFALSADVATDAMALFNLTADQMEEAVAGIVAVTQMSKFGVEDYRFALAAAGPVLSSMGVSLNEFNALITASASSFASGRTAGTSWRLLMQNLVPATDGAKKMMQELNLITEDGKNQFFDANGALKDTTEIIRLLQSGFGGLSAEQTTAYARAIFGQEALGALNAAMGMSVDHLADLITHQSDVNALNESAATRMNTVTGAWDKFNDTIDELGIAIGTIFLPYLRDILEWATEFVNTHAPKVVEIFTKIGDAIRIFGERLDEGHSFWRALKEAIVESDLFGSQTQKVLDFIGFVERLTRAVQNFFTEQQKFEDDPPWLLALMRFGDFVRPILQWIGDLIARFVEWSDVLTALGVVIGSVIIKRLAAMVAAASPVVRMAALLIGAIALLRTAWEENWGGIQEKFRAVVDYLQERFGPLFDAIRDFGGDALQEIIAWATGNETEFTAVGKIWEAARDTFKAVFNDLVDFVRGLLPDWVKETENWGAAAVTWIEEAVPKAVAWIGEYVNRLVGWIADNAGTWQTNLIAWQEAAIEWIETAIPAAVAKLGEWGAAIWGWLTEHLPIWSENLATWGAAASQWIVDTFEPTTSALARWGGKLWEWLDENLPTWGETLMKWGVAAYRWIEDAIPVALEKLGEWALALIDWISTNLPDWIAKLEEWGEPAWRIFAEEFPEAAELFKSAWEFARDKVIPIIEGLIEGLGLFGAAVWEGRDRIADFIEEHRLWDAATIITVGKITKSFIPILTGPLGLVAKFGIVLGKFALLTAAVGVLLTAWEKDWGGVRTKTEEALKKLNLAFDGTRKALETFGEKALEAINDWKEGSITATEAVMTIWDEAKIVAEAFFSDVAEFARQYLTPYTESVNEWSDTTDEAWLVRFPFAAQSAEKASDQIRESFDKLMETIREAGELWEWLRGVIEVVWEAIVNVIDWALGVLILAINSFVTTVLELFGLIINLLQRDWPEAWDNVTTITETKLELFRALFEPVVRGILDLFVPEEWRAAAVSMFEGFMGGAKSMWEGAGGAGAWLKNTWNSIPGGFRSALGIRSPSTVMRDLGLKTMEGLGQGMESGWKNHVASALEDALSDTKKKMDDIAAELSRPLPTPSVPKVPAAGPSAPGVSAPGVGPGGGGGSTPPPGYGPGEADFTIGKPQWMSDSAWAALTPMQREKYREEAAKPPASKTPQPAAPKPEPVVEPLPRPLATNANMLFDAIFGRNNRHITAFREVFDDLLATIPKFAQQAFDALAGPNQTFDWNMLEGMGFDTGALYSAVVGLIGLNDPSAAQVGGIVDSATGAHVSGGERMIQALNELVDLMKKEGHLKNNFQINLQGQGGVTDDLLATVALLNALYG